MKDQKDGKNPLAEGYPWMNYFVIDFLQQHLNKDSKVFEYGGGGSTIFFTKRIGSQEVVTVEHDSEWYKNLAQTIAASGIKTWKGIQQGPEVGALGNKVADPNMYLSDDPGYSGMNFKSYASAIDSFPENYFDLVIVDGRARNSCLMHAISKVKSGGYLLLDNAERSYYLEKTSSTIEKEFNRVLAKTGPCPYTSEFTTTMIWRKKA